MSGTKLLPCPFCGSANIARSEGRGVDGESWWYIECDDCGAMAAPMTWNRRHNPPLTAANDDHTPPPDMAA